MQPVMRYETIYGANVPTPQPHQCKAHNDTVLHCAVLYYSAVMFNRQYLMCCTLHVHSRCTTAVLGKILLLDFVLISLQSTLSSLFISVTIVRYVWKRVTILINIISDIILIVRCHHHHHHPHFRFLLRFLERGMFASQRCLPSSSAQSSRAVPLTDDEDDCALHAVCSAHIVHMPITLQKSCIFLPSDKGKIQNWNLSVVFQNCGIPPQRQLFQIFTQSIAMQCIDSIDVTSFTLKLIKQYQCKWCNKILIDANWMLNVHMFQFSNVQIFKCSDV